MHKPVKVLFICKKGHSYGSYDRQFSGLFNSTFFVARAVAEDPRIHPLVVQVNDNNDIDREVHRFRPDIVIIEAIWVTPLKFHVLRKLHPRVRWVVHLHSDIPFIAQEGMSVTWIKGYLENDIGLISNSKELIKAIELSFGIEGCIFYLPNCYQVEKFKPRIHTPPLDIGCFGAIRPLKNQLIQACAAIAYANSERRFMNFHINSSRIEGGDAILKNMRALFRGSKHELVEHDWHSHHDFIRLIKRMDLVMQVSYTETFNIVAADSISSGVPVVASPEIDWLATRSTADPNSIEDIISTVGLAIRSRLLLRENRARLRLYAYCAKRKWIRFILGCH